MDKIVDIEISKLLRERNFSWECLEFFQKDGETFSLNIGVDDSGNPLSWDWNLKGGKMGNLSKTIPYPNNNGQEQKSEYYSAPTISKVINWLYETHDMWFYIVRNKNKFYFIIEKDEIWENFITFDSSTECCLSGIKFALINLIK